MMPPSDWDDIGPEEVLGFWFPQDGHEAGAEAHRAFWTWRMRGGADEPIRVRFGGVAEAAARGLLDHWAATPRGRLALVIALDQFPRSMWRDTPGAFGQDIKAARLVLEGLENGHYDALAPWEKAFCLISIGHCEGPGHLARMERVMALSRALVEAAPEHLRLTYRVVEDQNRWPATSSPPSGGIPTATPCSAGSPRWPRRPTSPPVRSPTSAASPTTRPSSRRCWQKAKAHPDGPRHRRGHALAKIRSAWFAR